MSVLPFLTLLACTAAPQTQEEQRAAEQYVRIGHYQCECRQGDFEANLKTVRRGLKLAQFQWTNEDFAMILIAFRLAYCVGQTVWGRLLERV
jgi:hypothetical protein